VTANTSTASSTAATVTPRASTGPGGSPWLCRAATTRATSCSIGMNTPMPRVNTIDQSTDRDE
jgi:hypothetical protein